MKIKRALSLNRIALCGLTILALSTILRLNYPDAAYAAGSFEAGNIISDAKMAETGTMNEAQIRDFINQKNASCPASNGLCFRNYRENGLDAARIIYEASQEQRINPQVILSTIQKEQGLVTTARPAQWMYNSAMGYNCPDSTPGRCGSEEQGFMRQVIWGSTMFRAILDGGKNWSNRYSSGTRWFTPYIVGNNEILWNPNSSCGKSTVLIENRATQALYNYTPYRPNQAALNAGYGSGDSCSSYGNRNFYLYMKDWFGYVSNPVVLVGSPTTVSWGEDRIDVFVKGSDGALWQKWYDDAGGWRNWVSLGGNLGSSPAASSRYAGKINVFNVDGNGELKQVWFDKGWKPTESLGKPSGANLVGSPTTVSWGEDRIDVFVKGSDGALWQKWYDDAGGWRNWVSLGGNLGSSPAASSRYAGKINVFNVDGNGELKQVWFDKGWKPTESLGKPSGANLVGSPTTVSWGEDRIDVFVKGSDGALWQKWYDDAGGWRNWVSLGGNLGSSPAASSRYAGKINVFNVDGNGELKQVWFDKGWKPTESLGKPSIQDYS